MPDLQQETTELLQRLIRFDTVNPPGGEREAQEYLRGYLEEAGFECELLELVPHERILLRSRVAQCINVITRWRKQSHGILCTPAISDALPLCKTDRVRGGLSER